MRRPTRRALAAVLLLLMLGPLAWALLKFAPPVFAMQVLSPLRWYVGALIAVALAGNFYGMFAQASDELPPAKKPRPTHLKIVKDD
jgi:endonuclease/exonuclease/phosphatase (EEP) superfamily protein YafD